MGVGPAKPRVDKEPGFSQVTAQLAAAPGGPGAVFRPAAPWILYLPLLEGGSFRTKSGHQDGR